MLKKIIFIIVGILLINFPAQSGELSISGLLKWNSGNYIYSNVTNTAYFNTSFQYKTDRYSLSINVPMISQNTDMITHMSGGIIPTADGHENEFDNDEHDHDMFSDGHMGEHMMNWKFSDLFLNVGWTMLKEADNIPALSFIAFIKFPTASTKQNLGTGEMDYGIGISTRKNLDFVYGFLDINYYILGDPIGYDLKNPIGFGLGIGNSFLNEKIGLSVYYYGYTDILQGIEPPRELSLNINYQVNHKYQLNGGLLFGFSKTSPDLGLFVGSSVSF
ncbi:hypothetical protein H8E88_34235 [candidate division KSB1 bacterium]|nr:hypothetical protein [candidate division KSB1 bacterium]MBL7093853.1 hypothetical protein [candidate division KSB1 bacterium]